MNRIGQYSQNVPAFTRRWWINSGKTFLWVSVVTILIWVYADLEKTETKDLSVKVRLGIGSSGNMVLSSPEEMEVKFAVRGSNSAIERFSRNLGDQGWVIPVDVSETGVQGENMLDTAKILDKATGASKSGLTIASVAPSFLKATLDRPQMEFHARLVLQTGSKELALLDKTDLGKRELDVRFKLQGNRDNLNRFQRDLTDGGLQIKHDFTGSYAIGKHEISLPNVLAAAEVIAKSGLRIVPGSVSPASTTVELDQAILVPDVEVRFRSTGATLGEVTIRPARVGLYVAKTQWDEILKAQPKPMLDTVTVDLQNALPEKPLSVALAPFIAGVPVKPLQPNVEVDVKISQLTDEKTLAVPIRLLTPQVWMEDGTWDRYVLKRKDPGDLRKNITFRGAKKDIERLRPEDVDAYLVLTDNDKVKTDSWLPPREVEIRLPKDMHVQVAGEKPTISFRLDPRGAAPAAP